MEGEEGGRGEEEIGRETNINQQFSHTTGPLFPSSPSSRTFANRRCQSVELASNRRRPNRFRREQAEVVARSKLAEREEETVHDTRDREEKKTKIEKTLNIDGSQRTMKNGFVSSTLKR